MSTGASILGGNDARCVIEISGGKVSQKFWGEYFKAQYSGDYNATYDASNVTGQHLVRLYSLQFWF
jgi:hypothetical protein